MKQAIDFDKVETLSVAITDYAQTLNDADCLRLAAQLLNLTNCVQQYANISQDAMWHARKTTTLFDKVDKDDSMDPGYHLHNLLEDMADSFDELADHVEQDNCPEEELEAIRVAALNKLTDTEKAALGLE